MARRWVEFGLGPKGSTQHRIHVSASPDGILRLNKRAFEVLGSPAALALLFDPQTATIGLRPTSPDMPNAYRTNYKEKEAGTRFSCRTFFRANDIRLSSSISFPTARIEDGVLILELKYRVPLPKNGRSKAHGA
ncbi:MAG: hypothetical protein KBD94_04380 [Pyrinomonadaceae bacterium]|nr:hypothetical protein [Pyrinomonadaceae bacterium]